MVHGLLVFDGTLAFSVPPAWIALGLGLLLVDLAADPRVAGSAVLAVVIVPAGKTDPAVVSEVEVAGENLAAADTLDIDCSAADKPVDAAAAAADEDGPRGAPPHQQPPAEPAPVA